jgi:acyl carrier protein
MNDEIISTLEKQIVGHILKQPGRSLAPDAPLISSGVIDSFHLVDLAWFVEDTFGVQIDDSELNADTFDTLRELAALIRARQG